MGFLLSLILVVSGAALGLHWMFGDALSTPDIADLLYSLLLVTLIGSSLLYRYRGRGSQAVRDMLLWVAIILVAVMGYSFRKEFSQVKERIMANLFPVIAVQTFPGEIMLQRSADGHFNVDALVNGTEIRFMVDTGASRVVLTQRDAEKIGLDLQTLSYTERSMTANGMAWGAPTRLEVVKIGDIIVRDVRASVSQGGLKTGSLLGMSFINQLDGFSIEGDMLRMQVGVVE